MKEVSARIRHAEVLICRSSRVAVKHEGSVSLTGQAILELVMKGNADTKIQIVFRVLVCSSNIDL